MMDNTSSPDTGVPSKGIGLAKYKCPLCSPVARCIVNPSTISEDVGHKTKESDALVTLVQANHQEEEEKCMESGELIGMVKSRMKKLDIDPSAPGLFCCSGLKHDIRSSSANFPHDKYGAVLSFIAALNDDKENNFLYSQSQFSQNNMRKITKVIKVNQVVEFEDRWTALFTSSDDSDNNRVNYINFKWIDKGHKFEPTGGNSYLAFFCKEHRNKYRVGYAEVKWSKNGQTATTGNPFIDRVMELPIKAKFNL